MKGLSLRTSICKGVHTRLGRGRGLGEPPFKLIIIFIVYQDFINPQRACAERVIVVILSVSLSRSDFGDY